jgi:hypothetical protein
MKKFALTIITFGIIFISCAISKAQDNKVIAQHYEYASFSSMGTKSCIVWPDGTVLHLADKFKRPSDTNEKMYYETMAFNVLDQQGYVLYSGDYTPMNAPFSVGHEDDLMFRRPIK